MAKAQPWFGSSPLWALLRVVDIDLASAAQRLGVVQHCLSQWVSCTRSPAPHAVLFLTEVARASVDFFEQCVTLDQAEAESALERKLPANWKAVAKAQCELGRKLLALADEQNQSLAPELREAVTHWAQSTPLKKRYQAKLPKEIAKAAQRHYPPARRGGRPKKTQTENGASAA